MSASLPRAFEDLGLWVGGAYAIQQVGRSAFILIALGESIVIIGTTLAGVPSPTASRVTGFVVALLTSVTLWWLYFDSSAEAAAEKIVQSKDPGRLGRSAYHMIHPIMVAGIIVTAAADEELLAAPGATATTAAAWMILAGPALFLAGCAAAVVAVVAVTDRLPGLRRSRPETTVSPRGTQDVRGGGRSDRVT